MGVSGPESLTANFKRQGIGTACPTTLIDRVSFDIWGKLAETLKESVFQRKGRLDKEMATREMGKNHAGFRMAWEELLPSMSSAEMIEFKDI